MKFRDPETGDVFEDIVIAKKEYCHKTDYCEKCPIGCFEFARKNPAEAARLMGYEVIDDSSSDSSTEIDETPTDTPTTLDDTPTEKLVKQKPRLAEVLGVEVGEHFRVGDVGCDFWIEADGWPRSELFDRNTSSKWVVNAINHPESIIRAPRLTESEIAIMRAVGAKWVSLDTSSMDEAVALWSDKPENDESGDFCSPLSVIAIVTAARFPSVKPGECIGPIDTSTTAMSGN